MRIIVGTYRKRAHIETCLTSIELTVKGADDIVFIDDSGDNEHCDWLQQFGKVVRLNRVGYHGAMQALCEAADGQQAFVVEEDFTFTHNVNLHEMSEMLYHRPYLAQIALLRPPVYTPEIIRGGLIEALEDKGFQFHTVNGLIEHGAIFTCNPSVWRADVFSGGWPQCEGSEMAKTKQLLGQGYRFAYLTGIRCEHHGEREGYGY